MSQMDKLIKSYIPMTEASFLLLGSLIQENHGYGIMQTVSEMTDGRVNLGAGTVYTILYKMENDGLIVATREVERRKVYRATETGLQILYHETMRLRQLNHIADCLEQMIAS